jgi:hypothetical protein
VVIKGNTHNQLVTNGNFVNTTGFSGTSATISTANNVLTITGNGVSANTGCEMSSNLPQFPSVGDKMYYRCMARVMNANAASLSLIEVNSGANTTVQSVSNPVQNQWYLLSNVITVPADVGTVCKPRVFATYADAATANGKITETQLWQVFNLTKEYGAGNEPTKANCDLMFANYQATGVNSTLPVRLSSVGKNLFDGEWEIGTIDTATGSKISSSTWIRSKNFIRIMPSNNYTIGVWSGERYIFLYDINKKFIKYAFGDTLTALDTTNAYYVKIIHNSTDLAKQILIRFTVAPSGYEPYKSGGEAYITWGEKGKGDSLPNGTKDEFNESTGVYTQNIGSKVLQASDIVALETGGTNVDTITINKPTDFINYNTTAATTAYSLDGYITENVLFSSMDNVSNINKISSRTDNTKFRLIVAKGTFASLAATQVALAGKSLNYQLAAKNGKTEKRKN